MDPVTAGVLIGVAVLAGSLSFGGGGSEPIPHVKPRKHWKVSRPGQAQHD
jgi:hypothetical protein